MVDRGSFLPEKEMKAKRANVPSTIAALNPEDLKALGVSAGAEVEIMTQTRSLYLAAEAKSDVEQGFVGLSESNMDKLDIVDGDKVLVAVTKAAAGAVEEYYEPPP